MELIETERSIAKSRETTIQANSEGGDEHGHICYCFRRVPSITKRHAILGSKRNNLISPQKRFMPAASIVLLTGALGRRCSAVGDRVFEEARWSVIPFAMQDNGDRVQIGARAKNLGRVRAGDDAIIGAIVVVVHDAADDAVVGGSFARNVKWHAPG
jgi:hypothetical protein